MWWVTATVSLDWFDDQWWAAGVVIEPNLISTWSIREFRAQHDLGYVSSWCKMCCQWELAGVPNSRQCRFCCFLSPPKRLSPLTSVDAISHHRLASESSVPYFDWKNFAPHPPSSHSCCRSEYLAIFHSLAQLKLPSQGTMWSAIMIKNLDLIKGPGPGEVV